MISGDDDGFSDSRSGVGREHRGGGGEDDGGAPPEKDSCDPSVENSMPKIQSIMIGSSASGRLLGINSDFMDLQLSDVNGNHVGIDLNGFVQLKSPIWEPSMSTTSRAATPSTHGSSNDATTNDFTVSISYSNVKPKNPILKLNLDMAQYMNDFVYVGFHVGMTCGLHRRIFNPGVDFHCCEPVAAAMGTVVNLLQRRCKNL
ncbi:hypothetical protein PIB30_006233 [Stylosanthes scabra]|uniref:Legume lectin domain-containing protein n=1 Tax=Stylosanthes scabra TaxID=79078 RepID=A0ABU6Z676_9FABA|nr:hypothetical protein [Stylosanthes scabra]